MEMTIEQQRAIALANARRRAAQAASPQEPAAPPAAEVPQFDPMGNPTGATAPAPEAPSMRYGEQMAHVGQFVDQMGRKYASEGTFGLADKFAAGMRTLTGDAPSYDEALAQERAQTAEASKNPLAQAAGVAGMLTTAGGLVKNGVSLVPRLKDASLVVKALGMGAEGGAYGAANKVGHTDGNLSDYGNAAVQGFEDGAKVGAALPIAGKAIGAAYQFASPYVQRVLPNISRGASGILGNVAAADRAGIENLSALGPEAMIADAGPSFRGLAQGVANKPSEEASLLVNALEQRFKGREARLKSDADKFLGNAVVPSQVEADLTASRESLSPAYEDAIKNARPLTFEEGANLRQMAEELAGSQKGAGQRLLNNAVDLIAPVEERATQIPGQKAGGYLAKQEPRRIVDTSPQGLMATRKAIDGMIAKVEDDPQLIKEGVGGRLQQLRTAVDEQLYAINPKIKDIDAQFAELARQSEGLQRGSNVLDGGKTAIRPQELAGEVQQGAVPQGTLVGPSAVPFRVKQGTRAEIDRMMGTQPNDLAATKKATGGELDWNREKMNTLFGDENTQGFVNAQNREQKFSDLYADVAKNSRTGPSQAAGKMLDEAGPREAPLDMTLTGLGTRGVQTVARALVSGSKDKAREEIGRILAASGPERDAVVEALLQSVGRRKATGAALERSVANPAVVDALASAYARPTGPRAMR